MIQTQTYVRKPLYVEAVQVTPENFNEIAIWCKGDIQYAEERGRAFQFIAVRVTNPMNPRQCQARVGDWILTSERGYKVYTPKAFEKAFDPNTNNKEFADEVDPATEGPGFTAAEIQQMFRDQSLKDTPLDTTEMAAVSNEPIVPIAPDPNIVYPTSPETTA